MNKSKKLSEIKKNHYNFQREDAIKQFGLDLKFKNQPYTYLRWRFNMEISTYLIYLFLRTSLSANFISLIYIILSPLCFFLIKGLKIKSFPIIFKNRIRGKSNTNLIEIFNSLKGIIKIHRNYKKWKV